MFLKQKYEKLVKDFEERAEALENLKINVVSCTLKNKR